MPFARLEPTHKSQSPCKRNRISLLFFFFFLKRDKLIIRSTSVLKPWYKLITQEKKKMKKRKKKKDMALLLTVKLTQNWTALSYYKIKSINVYKKVLNYFIEHIYTQHDFIVNGNWNGRLTKCVVGKNQPLYLFFFSIQQRHFFKFKI